MKTSDFLKEMYEFLEIESIPELKLDTNLRELEEFDSLTIMTLIAFADEYFNKRFKATDFRRIQTVEDVMSLIGIKNFN